MVPAHLGHEGSHGCCSVPCKHSACQLSCSCLISPPVRWKEWLLTDPASCPLSSERRRAIYADPSGLLLFYYFSRKLSRGALGSYRWLWEAFGKMSPSGASFPPPYALHSLRRELELSASLCGNWHPLQMSWPFVHWHSVDFLPPLKGKTNSLVPCRMQSLWQIHLGSRRGVRDALCHTEFWF